MIIELPHSPETKSEVGTYIIHLSGGYTSQGGLYTYYLKDVSSNSYHSKSQIRTVTDDNTYNQEFQKIWGPAASVESLVTSWVTVLDKALQGAPRGSDIKVNLIWIEGKFPIKPFEYLFNLTSEANLPRIDKLDKEKVKPLYEPYNIFSIDVLKIKSKPYRDIKIYK